MLKKTRGMTLIETIIILGIVAVIALFAFQHIPSERNKSQKKACIGNLWLVKMSKNQWALDERKITGAEVEWTDIVPNYLEEKPECPTAKISNSYTLNNLGIDPTCVKGPSLEHELN